MKKFYSIFSREITYLEIYYNYSLYLPIIYSYPIIRILFMYLKNFIKFDLQKNSIFFS